MNLTNELKLLLVATEPHTSAQAVVDNIENTPSIDATEAWDSRLSKYISDKQLGAWTGEGTNKVYVEPTLVELEESFKANVYIQVVPVPRWELERYESEAAYIANEYARDRKAVYPKLEDQLDKIFHEGIDAWKADIQAVKDKYPKG